jgi:hypothetical protein|eukprot:COSAG06_NODE_6139_length_3089_cov_55.324749_2_plen_73_part_00
MEVGEGSAIARDMGRSWTTHTGGSGAGGSKQGKRKKKKKGSAAWASLEVCPSRRLRWLCLSYSYHITSLSPP